MLHCFLATRLRGAYKVVPFNEAEYKAKTKRSTNTIDDAMKIANLLFDRSSLNPGKKDVKIAMDKQGTAGTSTSIPKKVGSPFNEHLIGQCEGSCCLKKRKKTKSRSYSPAMMKRKTKKHRHISLENETKAKKKWIHVIASRICSGPFAISFEETIVDELTRI